MKAHILGVLLCMIFIVSTSWAENIKVACVGNSITYGANIVNREKNCYPAQLQALLGEEYEVRNFGINGTTALHKGDHPYIKTEAYKQSLAFAPNVVFIKLGTNDSKPQNIKYKSEFESDYIQLIRDYKALPSHPRVILLGPLRCFLGSDSGIREKVIQEELLPVIRKIVAKENVEYIDMHNAVCTEFKEVLMPDRLHPSSIGAGRIAKKLALYLNPELEYVNPCTYAIPGSEYRSAAGWTKGSDWHKVSEEITEILSHQELDILFLGNSITQNMGGNRKLVTYKPGKAAFDKAFKGMKWESAGISGDRTEHLIWRLRNGHYGTCKAKYAVITIGVNNIGEGHCPADIAEGICQVVEEAKRELPNTELILMGLLPTGYEKDHPKRVKCDAIHSILAQKEWGDVVYVNPTSWFVNKDGTLKKECYISDCLHLNEKGYEVWGEHLKTYLMK